MYSLHAVFIYNFTKYIDWEKNNNDQEFVIGVLGNSPVANSLSEIARTRLAKNKKIVIRNYSKPEEIERCNILFIPKANGFSLESILDHTGKGILTISEEDGFAKQGTALNFKIVNDKLKFEANLKSIYAAGLTASSQLLKLAIIVDQ